MDRFDLRFILKWAAAGAIATSPIAARAEGAQPTPLDIEDAHPDPTFGPAPFVETAPLLAELRALLSERAPSRRALTAGLAVLNDWLRAPGPDPLATATGEWLRARLLTRLNHPEALAAWEALAVSPGAFSDMARTTLAELARKARGRSRTVGAAAHWTLTRAPWSPGYLADVRGAIKDLDRLGEEGHAVELLEQTLLGGMSRATRLELVLMLADLHASVGQGGRARDLLAQSFWLEDDPDPRLLSALERLDAAPSRAERFFHSALHASRGDAAKLTKAAPRAESPVADAALALLARWSDDDAKSATLRLLPDETPRRSPKPSRATHARGSAAPLEETPPRDETADATASDASRIYVALARGVLLRKLDRDDEAIGAFEAAIEAAPDHPLAHLARAHASTLMRASGRAREASVLDEQLLATAIPGDLHRDALWRLGFGAILAGDAPSAERHLRELERRHGGEADLHSLCWFERARYWRGRAADLTRAPETAQAHYASVIARFPAGWYALLSRLRAPSLRAEPSTEMRWDIARDDPMATALALYRLGEEDLARSAFEALLAEDQLPGHGRRLLADLLELSGESTKAARVLKHDLIPPTMPGEDPEVAYFDWYPLRFEEALAEAAHDNGLPSSLLAGIVSVETRFNARAKSHAGAIGAAQLLPSTGTAVGRRVFGRSFDASRLTEPDVNLAVAARYLTDLLDSFRGHTALAVAAYNAGPANVRRWVAARPNLDLDAFVETIPFEQARRYVMRVLSDAEIYRRLYGLDGEPVPLSLSLDHSARR